MEKNEVIEIEKLEAGIRGWSILYARNMKYGTLKMLQYISNEIDWRAKKIDLIKFNSKKD